MNKLISGKIITLCGSVTKTPKEYWDNYAQFLTLEGHMVFMVNVWNMRDWLHSKEGAETKIMLDILHKQKILHSDEVHVLRMEKYIGESTRSEIVYALEHGKIIEFVDFYENEEDIEYEDE